MNPSEQERADAFCQELAIILRRLAGKDPSDSTGSPELPKLVIHPPLKTIKNSEEERSQNG